MDEPTADSSVPGHRAEPKEAERDPTWQVKALVGLGGWLALVGVAILLWMLDSAFDGGVRHDWLADGISAWWLANVVLGGFLLWQWVRSARGKRLLMPPRRLWRTSALFMGYLASIIVFYFAADYHSGGCVHYSLDQVAVFLPALLTFPLSGLWLTTTLWLHASHP